MPEKSKKTIDNRARVWAFVAYPDSIPKDLETILRDELHLHFAISPLHDADINADDTQKKPHWHIVLKFGGKKSYEQVLEITKKCNATIPQKVSNLQGLLRYFCHLDNPEKAQYDINDIKSVGIDVKQEILNTKDYEDKISDEIIDIIENNDLKEYRDLILFLMKKDDLIEHKRYAKSHTIFFDSYLKSRRYKIREMQDKLYPNPEPQEIVYNPKI